MANDYLSVAQLKGDKGNQTYPLPADFDPARFNSVVIWCQQFRLFRESREPNGIADKVGGSRPNRAVNCPLRAWIACFAPLSPIPEPRFTLLVELPHFGDRRRRLWQLPPARAATGAASGRAKGSVGADPVASRHTARRAGGRCGRARRGAGRGGPPAARGGASGAGGSGDPPRAGARECRRGRRKTRRRPRSSRAGTASGGARTARRPCARIRPGRGRAPPGRRPARAPGRGGSRRGRSRPPDAPATGRRGRAERRGRSRRGRAGAAGAQHREPPGGEATRATISAYRDWTPAAGRSPEPSPAVTETGQSQRAGCAVTRRQSRRRSITRGAAARSRGR